MCHVRVRVYLELWSAGNAEHFQFQMLHSNKNNIRAPCALTKRIQQEEEKRLIKNEQKS
jgi:hypothetical protein